jgi:hypothetical protein
MDHKFGWGRSREMASSNGKRNYLMSSSELKAHSSPLRKKLRERMKASQQIMIKYGCLNNHSAFIFESNAPFGVLNDFCLPPPPTRLTHTTRSLMTKSRPKSSCLKLVFSMPPPCITLEFLLFLQFFDPPVPDIQFGNVLEWYKAVGDPVPPPPPPNFLPFNIHLPMQFFMNSIVA